MKIVISPSKTMLDTPWYVCKDTRFFESDKTDQLISLIQSMTKQEMEKRFKIKGQLLDLTFERYQHRDDLGYIPAFYTMNGLVYKQLSRMYNEQQHVYINNHIRMLDALHGVLSPCNLVKPYRLDFLVKFNQDLYKFWEGEIDFDDELIINLASNEFSKLIDHHKNRIDIEFYQEKDGTLRAQSTHVKMARGKLLEYMIVNGVKTVKKIKQYSEDGYKLSKEKSSDTKLVFIKYEGKNE